MKRLRYPAALVLVLTACGAVDYAPPAANAAGAPLRNYVPGEFIVTVRPSISADQLRRIYAELGVKEVRNLGGGRFLLRLTADPGLDAVKRIGEASASVDAVQRNFIYRR